ncbi:MAG: metallophosphoesterase [Bacteroidota bacterium]
MKKIFFIIAALAGGCSIQSVYVKDGTEQSLPAAGQDTVLYSLFLIGDAGEALPDGKEKVLTVLTDDASREPERSTIIFLGDNIYPAGLPAENHEDRKEMERRLDAQIDVARQSGARTIFVPGNHDWNKQRRDGLAAIRRQQKYLSDTGLESLLMLPADGMPGPSFVDIRDSIRIIFLDTQWWLHEYEKPLYAAARTEEQTKTLFLDSLSALLRSGRITIVAAHHPLESHGEHGGFFDWRDHFFPLRHAAPWLWIPLPGIGSMYPLSRLWGITQQDFSGSRYAELRFRLDSTLSLHPPLAYSAGHEHTLQILEPRSGYYHLVSGHGMSGHHAALTTGENTIFARRAPGYMRLDIFRNGGVRVSVVESGTGADGTEIFSIRIR